MLTSNLGEAKRDTDSVDWGFYYTFGRPNKSCCLYTSVFLWITQARYNMSITDIYTLADEP